MTVPDTDDAAIAAMFERWQRRVEKGVYDVHMQCIPFDFKELAKLMHRAMGITQGGSDFIGDKFVEVYGRIYPDKYRLQFSIDRAAPIYMFFTEDDIRGFYNRYF